MWGNILSQLSWGNSWLIGGLFCILLSPETNIPLFDVIQCLVWPPQVMIIFDWLNYKTTLLFVPKFSRNDPKWHSGLWLVKIYLKKSNYFNIHNLATFQLSFYKTTRSHKPHLCLYDIWHGWFLILPDSI